MNTAAPKARMTQAEYAAYRQVLPSAVSNWKSKGYLVFAEDAASGRPLVDVARSDARVNANVDPSRGRPTRAQAEPPSLPLVQHPTAPPPGGDEGGEVSSIRLDYLRAQTEGKLLANARASGELVAVAEFEARAEEAMRAVRERVHSVLRTNAERMLSERDVRNWIATLGAEMDKAFDELAERLERGAVATDVPADDEETVIDEAAGDGIAA